MRHACLCMYVCYLPICMRLCCVVVVSITYRPYASAKMNFFHDFFFHLTKKSYKLASLVRYAIHLAAIRSSSWIRYDKTLMMAIILMLIFIHKMKNTRLCSFRSLIQFAPCSSDFIVVLCCLFVCLTWFFFIGVRNHREYLAVIYCFYGFK